MRSRIAESGALISLSLVAFLVTRVTALAGALGFRGDEVLYGQWSVQVLAGQFPVGDEKYQYPPGAGLLFASMEAAPGSFHRAFTASAVIADVSIFVLILAVTLRRGGSWWGVWTWILGGFAVGGLLYERFDVFPAVLAVLALLFISRSFLAGGLVGLGAMVKVWPIVIVLGFARQKLWTALAGVLSGVLLVGVLGVLLAQDAWSFLGGQSGRGMQIEAVLAAPLLLGQRLGVISVSTVDRFGSTELDSSASATLAWVGIAIAVLLIGSLGIQRLRGKLDLVPGVDVALAATLVFVAFNRVFSPQFYIWIAAVAAVALINRQSRMLIPVILMGLSAVPLVGFLDNLYWALQAQQVTAVGLQIIRALLVFAAALLAWWLVVSDKNYKWASLSNSRI